MDLELTEEQAYEILDQIGSMDGLNPLSMHIEDALVDEEQVITIDVLDHEIEPLYIALAGHKDLTVPVALLRAALANS